MQDRDEQHEICRRLIEAGLVSQEDSEFALDQYEKRGVLVQESFTRSRRVPVPDMLEVLTEVYGVPSTDLTQVLRDPFAVDALPKGVALEHKVAPLFVVARKLTLATANPNRLDEIDQLQFASGLEILPVVVLPQQIPEYLEEIYEGDDEDEASTLELSYQDATVADEEELPEGDEEDSRPIVKLVNLIFARAIQERATDIHLEPMQETLCVRFRVDGRLTALDYGIPASLTRAVVARIKVLSRLDIAIQRRPQDGKIRLLFAERAIDLRVSTYPTIRGEKVVMRILDKERTNFTLDNIGLSESIHRRWLHLTRRSEGILLVTGPTGSGKSSTLFASLRELHKPEVNIVTLEDPVEYELDGIAQGQVDPKAGFTFADGLRSILRQDPDIILVGEIRDAETAGIAVQAALTGHLVLASLHTNDAPSAVARLTDLGVPGYLLSAALLGVMAQRLVRRNCSECSAPHALGADVRKMMGPWVATVEKTARQGSGCEKCTNGYAGRTAVHELLCVNPEIASLISEGAPRETLAEAALEEGYRLMWEDALGKVAAGSTSLDEILRVLDVPPARVRRNAEPKLDVGPDRAADTGPELAAV